MVAAAIPMTNYFTPRCKTTRPGRQSRTELHLRAYLDLYDAMSEKERKLAAEQAWMPSREIIVALLDAKLLQRDRVEIIIVCYNALHPGHTPGWSELGRILGIADVNARLYGRQLVDLKRAEWRDGKFCLIAAAYAHPIIRARWPHIYRLLAPDKPAPADGSSRTRHI